MRVFIESALWISDGIITDCNSVEFHDEKGVTIPYYQESSCPAGQTFYWVLMDLPPNSDKTITVVSGADVKRTTSFDTIFTNKFADFTEFAVFKKEKVGFIQPFVLPNLEELPNVNLNTAADTFTNAVRINFVLFPS